MKTTTSSFASSARVLDGRSLAERLRTATAERVATFVNSHQVRPQLAAVLAGQDAASAVYVRNKRRACDAAGIDSQLVTLPESVTTGELLEQIQRLNEASTVHGILVQLPLPAGVDAQRVLDAVHPEKDVDGFHPFNVGLLAQGRPRFVPCTPLGILHLLQAYEIEVAGRHVVVVGRSDIVGKPLASLLGQPTSPASPATCNATVTLCHSRTRQLADFTRQADILIVAIGKPQAIGGEMIKPGAAVIDVGINRVESGLVGDADYASASSVAGWITPVPGGVGPLTVAMLLDNTVKAATLAVGSDG